MSLVKIFLILTLVFVFFCLLWLAFIRHVNPISPKEFLLKANEAQLSEKWSEEIEYNVEDDGKFHIVTNVVLITHRHYNVDLLGDNTRQPTEMIPVSLNVLKPV